MTGSTASTGGFFAACRLARLPSHARTLPPLACLCLASCLALASQTWAAPIPPGDPRYLSAAPLYDENPEVSAEYSGTMTQESTYKAGNESDALKAKLVWKTKVTGPVDQIEYSSGFEPRIHWQLEQLSGEVTDKGVNISNNPFGCRGEFKSNGGEPGVGGVELPLDEPGFPATGGNPETNPDYSVIPPTPLALLESTITSETSDPGCSRSFWNSESVWGGPAGQQNESAWHDAIYPNVYFPVGGKYTKKIEFSCTKLGITCSLESGRTFNVKIESTIVFTSPGPPTTSPPIARVTAPPPPETLGPPTPFDWLPVDKRAARLDLAPALENAQQFCTPFALGAAGFGTGVLLLGATSTTAAVLVVTGSLTSFATEPFCLATLKRAADDIKRYRDPPDRNFRAVAQPARSRPPALPSCRRWRGKTLGYCKRLRAAESRWLGAAEEVAAIEEALVTTTNRESAALAAKDNAGIALQSAAGPALEAREATALAAKTAAGRETAETLRRAGVRFRLSRAQSKLTIKAMERALAKLGIPTATLTPLAGNALKPAATDLLAGLTR